MNPRIRQLVRGAAIVATALVVALGSILHCASKQVNGRVDARGRVVDAETGALLSGVEMRIRSGAFSLVGDDFGRTSVETRRIDGTFDVGCGPCTTLELQFSRAGYHPKRLGFGLDPYSDERRVAESDVVVALVKQGERVRLDRYQGVLKFSPKVEQVLPVELGPIVHSLSRARLAERAEQKGLPEAVGHVALVAETDAEGRIVETEIERWPKPARAYLDFAPAEGGVLPYEPQARNVDEIAVEMRRAPAKGYRPILELDPEADESRHFFVKIGDRYGRGEVTPVVIERTEDDRRVSASIQLLLSPEPGSRNLEAR